METALEFRKKWHVDEALKTLRARIDESRDMVAMDRFITLKGYIGVLELDLKNTQEKLNELRIQSK